MQPTKRSSVFGVPRPRSVGPVLVVLALFLVPLLPWAGTAAAQSPSRGDAFSYSFHRHVGSGEGAYEEYYDDTYSRGSYTILASDAAQVRFHAVYAWTYSNTEGLEQAGWEDRTVSFTLATRHYTGTRTDLDEYDTYEGTSLAIWFWIPPEVRQGDRVQILEENFTVTSVDKTVWTNWAPKRGIEVTASGTGFRFDSYGTFSYTYTDTYYFDRATGYVIAERYVEHDTGSWLGDWASFDWKEDFDITGSTYAISIDWVMVGATIGAVATVFLSLGGIGYAYRWWPRTVESGKYVERKTKVRRVRTMDAFPEVESLATTHFVPFLEDFARKAILAKDVVAVATAGGSLVGFAVYNREAKIGMVLCGNTAVTETLRKFVGATDFFSEFRHTVPEGIRSEAARYGVKITDPNAYNVFETYQVLQADLATVPRLPYDTGLVTRMVEADLPEVGEVAHRVYRVRSDRWLRAQFESGDIGFVARVSGRIVGFAFATCAGGHGRIHTLSVLPENRNAGIGRELMRARLEALRALGATDAIAEIADWNLPSLQVASSHGFRRVGEMFVETARTRRIVRTIVRR